MKKFYALLLTAAMVLSLAACGGSKNNQTATGSDYKLGMGVVVSTASSKTGTAQVDATVAVVVTDKDGKIVACRIDVAQTKLTVTDGVAQDAASVVTKSKMEKKDEYGMKKASAIGKEWFEQAEFFQNAVVGKTGAEVEAMPTAVNGSHVNSTDEAILAGCSMSIGEFKEAIVKACKDEYAKSFKAEADSFKLGLGVLTSVDSSTASATAEKDGSANMYSNFAGVVTGKDGKVLANLIDVIQPKIAFNTAGEITGATFKGTKKELKEGYNMKGSSAIGKEWYEQATYFETQVNGQTGVDSITEDTVKAGCTIHITEFKEVLKKAIANVK